MVFEVLEQHGEVIKSVPSVNELEEEDFDNTFSVLLVTKSPQEEIKKKLMKISEVKKKLQHNHSLYQYTKKRKTSRKKRKNG